MNPPDRQPILVTGCIRSGTSWVGHLLAACRGVGYINEPFNPFVRNESIFPLRLPWFWYYARESEGSELQRAFARALTFDWKLVPALRQAQSARDLRNAYRAWQSYRTARLEHRRPLVKDPVAFFSANWLSTRFGMRVVITVRHPAAFVESMVRKRWFHPLNHFLEQEALMEDLLAPFRNELESAHAAGRTDHVGHAALIWKLVYATALRWRRSRPDWIFVRNEDLAQAPREEFSILFNSLGLEPTNQTYSMIADWTTGASGRTEGLKRDACAAAFGWKNRMSPAARDRVRNITGEIAGEWYSEADWV